MQNIPLQDIDLIASKVLEKLEDCRSGTYCEERLGMTMEEHAKHHQAVRDFIEMQKRKQELYQKVSVNVLGWGIMGLITALGYVTWEWLKGQLK